MRQYVMGYDNLLPIEKRTQRCVEGCTGLGRLETDRLVQRLNGG